MVGGLKRGGQALSSYVPMELRSTDTVSTKGKAWMASQMMGFRTG